MRLTALHLLLLKRVRRAMMPRLHRRETNVRAILTRFGSKSDTHEIGMYIDGIDVHTTNKDAHETAGGMRAAVASYPMVVHFNT